MAARLIEGNLAACRRITRYSDRICRREGVEGELDVAAVAALAAALVSEEDMVKGAKRVEDLC